MGDDVSARTIVITDRAVSTEDGLFDPASIARFVVEHAGDVSVRVYVVIDMMNRALRPLAQFADKHGFIVWSVPATRTSRTWENEVERILQRERNGDVVVCDTHFKSDDPRIMVKRRVTR